MNHRASLFAIARAAMLLGVIAMAACSSEDPQAKRASLASLDVREGLLKPGNGEGTAGGENEANSLRAFEETVHPIVTAHCSGCHSDSAPQPMAPFFASADVSVGHQAVVQNNKVDFTDPASSRLVLRMAPDRHNCWSDCDANHDEMLAAVEAWRDARGAQEGDESDMLQTGSLLFADAGMSESETTTPPGVVVVEAESGTVKAPMAAMAVGDASGGMIVQTPMGAGSQVNANIAANDNTLGVIQFQVEIKEAGAYQLSGRVRAPDAASNSFYLRIDNGALLTWRFMPTGDQYVWDKADAVDAQGTPFSFDLTPGMHTVEVRQREERSALDAFVLTKDPNFDPTGATPGGASEVQLLTYDLSELLGGANVQFTIEVSDYSEAGYKFKNPTIVTATEKIKVKGVKLLVNGKYLPQHATYTVVDQTVEAPGAKLSESALVALKDKGNDKDQFSFAFDVLTIAK